MHRAVKISAVVGVATALVIGAVASASVKGGRPAQVGQPAQVRQQAQVRTNLKAAAALAQPASEIADQVAAARRATAKYETNLARAKADGYGIITRMIPNMGFHFLNPGVTGFDVRKPDILVYEHRGTGWQLGALEWVFTSMPAKPPLPGAHYGVFGAACHYVDGTFVFADSQASCAAKSPQSGAAFNFWHPRLITLHFWIWYPNPSGLYASTNPLVAPFNGG
jgi:hypothetical protein